MEWAHKMLANNRFAFLLAGFVTSIQGHALAQDVGYHTALQGTKLVAPQPANPITADMMLNSVYRLAPSDAKLKPYVGAGFGAEELATRIPGSIDRDWVPAYQVRGGVSYGFSQKLFGSIEYRWQKGQMPKLSVSGIPAKLEIKKRGFVVGVNYKL